MIKNKKENYKEKSRECFDKIANNYDNKGIYGKHARKMYNAILTRLSNCSYDSILDIGVGTGAVLSLILEERNVRASGIDLSPEMIRVAKEKLGNRVQLVEGDAENLIWEDNEFDVVICTDSFHHYPNSEKALDEMIRVGKNNGTLIIADPWMPTPIRQTANLFLRLLKDGDVKIYSKNDMIKLANGVGLTNITWKKLSNTAGLLSANFQK